MADGPRIFSVLPGDERIGQRVDRIISEEFQDLSRSTVQRLLEDGYILVNGAVVSKNYLLRAGDAVLIKRPEPRSLLVLAEDIPLEIVYEDLDLLVVNKPQGMVVHPAAGNEHGTLVNALLFHCGDSLSGINGVMRPGIVHRIDKDTSGLLIVAKSEAAHHSLAQQIKEHSFTREYEAVVHGILHSDSGTVSAPIGRHPVKRKQMAVTDRNSKNAVTHYHVIEQYNAFTHICLRLETGRTHQIRVHMAYIGHPVAGDPVYGPHKQAPGLTGQCLHARRIGFIHPKTGAYMEFESPLPAYFQNFLKRIR